MTGGSPEAVTSLRNGRVIRSGPTGFPARVVNTYPVPAHRAPAAARPACCRSWRPRSAAIVVLWSAITRRPASLFGGPETIGRRTPAAAPSPSASRRPSPGRSTATRRPRRAPARTRRPVEQRVQPGLTPISPARTAPFSAARGRGRQVGAEVLRRVLQVPQARAARPEQPPRALVQCTRTGGTPTRDSWPLPRGRRSQPSSTTMRTRGREPPGVCPRQPQGPLRQQGGRHGRHGPSRRSGALPSGMVGNRPSGRRGRHGAVADVHVPGAANPRGYGPKCGGG